MDDNFDLQRKKEEILKRDSSLGGKETQIRNLEGYVPDLIKDDFKIKQTNLSQFRKIVPALIEKGVENLDLSMFSQEMRNEVLNAVGEEHLLKGRLPEAVKVFLLTKNLQRLRDIAKNYEDIGLFGSAVDILKAIDDSEGLIRLGDRCLDAGRLGDAVRAIKHVGDKEKLVKIGYFCLEREKLDFAIEVFKGAGRDDLLTDLGEKWIREGKFEYAFKALELVGDKERINHLGDVLLKEGLFRAAYKAYSLAGNFIMADFIKQNFSEKNSLID
ncbi:MAG: hypothetical protein PHG05_00545 [Candidatus Nanoarchaeia archaeon]|nr:hypothetical protein [Candidatus Nanoarchaeia archaeon]